MVLIRVSRDLVFCFAENLFQEMVALPLASALWSKNAEAFFFSFGFEHPQYPVGSGGAYDAPELPEQKFSALLCTDNMALS